MVSLLKKFQYTIQEDLQKLFEKKEEQNPIQRLNHYIKEAEQQTEETNVLLKRQALLKQQLEKELEDTMNRLTKRQEQLALAKEYGEEVLIQFASQEVTSYETRQATLEQSVKEANNEWIYLEQKYEQMKHQLKDMKIRQLQLMGKENVIRAHHKMSAIIDATNETNEPELSHYIHSLSEKEKEPLEMTTIEQRLVQLEKEKMKSTMVENQETTEGTTN